MEKIILAVLLKVLLSKDFVRGNDRDNCIVNNLEAGEAILNKCPNGSLCTLVKTDKYGDINDPIGRSYNGRNWEEYAGDSLFDSDYYFMCNARKCSINLPHVDNEEKYQYSNCISPFFSRDDELARFMDQSTFGVTRQDLQSFDASVPVDVAIAQWIKNQIEDVKMTSHREYFRTHAIHHFVGDTDTFRSRRPCEVDSKWRKYAFSTNDYKKWVLIKRKGGKVELSIDGHVRTIVNSINWSDQSYIAKKGNLKMDELYQFCRVPRPCLNCQIRIKDKVGGSCEAITGGNPLINLNSVPDIFLQLSDDVQPIGEEFFENQNPQELIVVKEIDDPKCIAESSSVPVFGFHSGFNAYYIHSPPPVLLENTVDQPAQDGGDSSSAVTRGETICSNAPRTQFNEEFCRLSYDDNACRKDEDTGVLKISLDHDNIQTFYEATLNDPGVTTRYVYAIDNLSIDNNSNTHPPCRHNKESRWIPIKNKSTCEPNSLFSQTEQYLADLISNSNDMNPYVRSIVSNNRSGCNNKDKNKKGFEINVGGLCWRHVHQNHLNVYDMTWLADNYSSNEIKAVAESGGTILQLPKSYGSSNWNKNIKNFARLGRMGDVILFTTLSKSTLGRGSVERELRKNIFNKKPVVICGSFGEVANDVKIGGGLYHGSFDVAYEHKSTPQEVYINARKTIMTMIALNAPDQLRQRQAWALSQILTIASPSIENKDLTEMRLAYTDILVRNAFKSYRDILREISFNAMMAENLSYLDSMSTAYTYEESNTIIFPDENFAREIMQLYSIGLCKLNQDGSKVLKDGECELTYTNDEIIEYAKVWTGFTKREVRGNIESIFASDKNFLDPLKIKKEWRDKFPKLGLNSIYIADAYPLCADRPKYHFLRKNAKYRLLGSSSTPELQSDPLEWNINESAIRLTLKKPTQNDSPYLYNKLCNAKPNGDCDYKSVVVLDSDLICLEDECKVDTVRVVQIEGLFYEYISQPCVEQAFFTDAKKVIKAGDDNNISCADPRREVSSVACCESTDNTSDKINAVRKEQYWGERLTFDLAKSRCENDDLTLCSFPDIQDCDGQPDCEHNPYYWTDSSCSIKVKVDPDDGNVAIVYDADETDLHDMAKHVQIDSPSFFPVLWKNDVYPTPNNNCGSISSCAISIEGMCICTINVKEERAFGKFPSRAQVLDKLHIGAYEPISLGLNKSMFKKIKSATLYYKGKKFTTESVFKITDDFGRERFFKNIVSTVNIGDGTKYSFRNPPHFLSLTDYEARDAYFETDAAIDQFFYHQNTAPFVAIGLIKRFGISNPSPRYTLNVVTAFRTGRYTMVSSTGQTFNYGSSEYGDLAATIACILLDSEARDLELDLDPVHGSLLEPILKLYKLMRSMEIQPDKTKQLIEFSSDISLREMIGQEAYEIQTVFSYFLPDFEPAGLFEKASLVAPEAQVLTGPNIVGLLNGMYSLVKWGMKECYGGFFMNNGNCNRDPTDYEGSSGKLSYSPSNGLDSEDIVNELSTLLTGGRLSAEHKEIIKSTYDNEGNKAAALIMVQQLILISAEYHTSGATVQKSGLKRPDNPPPKNTNEPYKAVIFLLLAGGVDSYNMLIPSCEPLKTAYKTKRGILALEDNELSENINIPPENNQPCSKFALHHKLPILNKKFKEKELLFFANIGAMDRLGVDKTNYKTDSALKLFAHDHMQKNVQRLDPSATAAGTGILGRITAALSETKGTLGNNFQIGSTSIQESSTALQGGKPPSTIGKKGIQSFDPYPWNKRKSWKNFDLMPAIEEINNATSSSESSLYGEAWSSNLLKVIEDNKFLEYAMSQAKITKTFAEDDMSQKLLQVSKLIDTAGIRGVDRDFFFVQFGGWDHHSKMKVNLATMFDELNTALDTFWAEMDKQKNEDKVVLVATSDFGRTLTANSKDGSDHGWGGNYFMMGGQVKGGQMLGKYPSDLDGPLITKRARVIPTTPWDAVWYGISEWLGVTDAEVLNNIILNRETEIENGEFFDKTELFKDNALESARRSLRQKK